MRKADQLELDRIKPYPGNPRVISDDAVAAVADSIKQYGLLQPLVVTASDVIIAGHTRLMALKKIGWRKAWIVRAEHLTDDQIRAYRIADNRTGEMTDWDMDKLTEEAQTLRAVPGFTDDDLTSIRGLTYEATDNEPETNTATSRSITVTCPKCGHEFE